MIDVATLSVVRRWALRERLPIREIGRRMGLSPNTIRKYLRAARELRAAAAQARYTDFASRFPAQQQE